jgi:hypothetical protein
MQPLNTVVQRSTEMCRASPRQGTWGRDEPSYPVGPHFVSGGTPPYTYQWSGDFFGTDSSVSGTVTESSILYLDVWYAIGAHVAYSTSLTRCPSP